MTGRFDHASDRVPAPLQVPVAGGELQVLLPDRMSGQWWVDAAKIVAGEHVAGYPAGVMPDVELACRCGQTKVDALRVRLGHRNRAFCADCLQGPPLVGSGAEVAFRLADSDLFPYVLDVDERAGREIVLRGLVALRLPGDQVAVNVDGWPMPHLVDVDQLAERPATIADMCRFWPDLSDEQLRDAVSRLAIAGAKMTVVTGPAGESELVDREPTQEET